MIDKALLMFESILDENWKEKEQDFIINSRQQNIHAADNAESTNEVDEEEESSEEKEEKSEDFTFDDEEDPENDKEAPGEIDLGKALEYSKLKSILNQFRASHSLSDKEVNVELKQYFSRLSDEEKMALYVFIKGLTQVTLLDISGKTAHTPSSLSLSVSKTGTTSKEKKKSQYRAQQLSKDDKNDDKVEDIVNTPITTIGSGVSESYINHKESIKEILKIVKENE
jgi:hypothetical protein